MAMDPDDRDPDFARFATSIVVLGLVVTVLGSLGLYLWFQSGGASGPAGGTMRGLLQSARPSTPGLGPGQLFLFYTKDGRQLISTVAEVGAAPGLSTDELAKVCVQSLAEGRGAGLLRSPVPVGTRVLAVFVKQDLAVVNLSREFATGLRGGQEQELLAVYSVVNSLLYSIGSIASVQLLIEGETLPTLRGHIEIERPLIANTTLIRSS